MADAPNSSGSRVGTVIADRYRITAKLGEGGMGEVYRGVHESLRKPVALKFMVPSARTDAELAQRFEREAVATANLKHPNISETTDYGQLADGTLYLVMECIDGKNLRELAAGGKLPPARALGIVKQIGAALSFAHESDVVHRDLKPDNVIVFDRGSTSDIVKVIDFGVARMRSSFGGGKTALTQAGTVFGTPDYMAPEQALGQAVDPRADQYALGAIAYELFTGKPPYSADNTAALMFMHVGAPIPRVGDLAPDLPPQVSDVVAKMMAKLPDERFASVDEAVAALGRAFDAPPASQPMPAPVPVTLLSPTAPAVTAATPASSSKSNSLLVLSIAIGGFLALVVAIGLYFVIAPHLQGSESASTSDPDASDLATADTATSTATTTATDTKPTAATVSKPSAASIKQPTPAVAKPPTAPVITAAPTTPPAPPPTAPPPGPNSTPPQGNEPKPHGHPHH